MLPNVNYQDLEGEEPIEEITGLEYETMRNLYGFTEELRDILLQEKMAQTLELMVAHLCAYLGFLTVASLGIKQATALQIEIAKLLEEQAKTAYNIFCKYPVSSSLSTEEQTKNLDQLRKNSPGSLVVQTLRLGSFVWNSIRDLATIGNYTLALQKRSRQNSFVLKIPLFLFLKKHLSKQYVNQKMECPLPTFLIK